MRQALPKSSFLSFPCAFATAIACQVLPSQPGSSLCSLRVFTVARLSNSTLPVASVMVRRDVDRFGGEGRARHVDRRGRRVRARLSGLTGVLDAGLHGEILALVLSQDMLEDEGDARRRRVLAGRRCRLTGGQQDRGGQRRHEPDPSPHAPYGAIVHPRPGASPNGVRTRWCGTRPGRTAAAPRRPWQRGRAPGRSRRSGRRPRARRGWCSRRSPARRPAPGSRSRRRAPT